MKKFQKKIYFIFYLFYFIFNFNLICIYLYIIYGYINVNITSLYCLKSYLSYKIKLNQLLLNIEN